MCRLKFTSYECFTPKFAFNFWTQKWHFAKFCYEFFGLLYQEIRTALNNSYQSMASIKYWLIRISVSCYYRCSIDRLANGYARITLDETLDHAMASSRTRYIQYSVRSKNIEVEVLVSIFSWVLNLFCTRSSSQISVYCIFPYFNGVSICWASC